jgi:hypothetical protein
MRWAVARNARRRRFVAITIAVLFAAMPAALCLAAAASTRAEQEPCATMADGGGSSLQQHCCAVDAPNSSAVLSLALQSFAAAPISVETHVVGIDFNDAPPGLPNLESIALDSPRHPTYLRLSVFRI